MEITITIVVAVTKWSSRGYNKIVVIVDMAYQEQVTSRSPNGILVEAGYDTRLQPDQLVTPGGRRLNDE